MTDASIKKGSPLVEALLDVKKPKTPWYEKIDLGNSDWSRLIISAQEKEPGAAEMLSNVVAMGIATGEMPELVREYIFLKFWLMSEDHDSGQASLFFARKGAKKPNPKERSVEKEVVEYMQYYLDLGFDQGGVTKDCEEKGTYTAAGKTSKELKITPSSALKKYQRYKERIVKLEVRALGSRIFSLNARLAARKNPPPK